MDGSWVWLSSPAVGKDSLYRQWCHADKMLTTLLRIEVV